MTAPTTTVTVFFDEDNTGGDTFTLDDPVRGLLDSVYVLGGDVGTDVTGYVNSVSFMRGRNSPIFESIDAGTGSVQMNNEARTFDPLHTAGSFYGNIKPGKKIVVQTAGVTIFTGVAADWEMDYEVSGRSVAVIVLEDGLAQLGRQSFDEWTTTASQTAGPRLLASLARSEVSWNGGALDLDTGVSVLQADTVSWGSNVLNYCQLVAQSDYGTFFASREGLLTFRDRHSTNGATSTLSFADDGTGIGFQGVATAFGSETFYNRVSIEREGGTAQTAEAATAEADGIRALTLSGLLQDTDGQALDMAEYLASIYSTGEATIRAVTVNVNTVDLSTDEIAAILAVELNDVIDVTWTPNGVGDPIEQNCVVQGISHDISPANHLVSFYVGKQDGRLPFTLDDAVLGLLDGVGVLTF